MDEKVAEKVAVKVAEKVTEIVNEIVKESVKESAECILCLQQTRKKTNIEKYTQHYVEGVGQLCRPCYLACYNTSTTDDSDDWRQFIYE